MKVVVEHLETNFPEFWDLVFKDIAAGLKLLLPCAYLFFVITLLIGIYSMCECICCPYRKNDEPITKGDGAQPQKA